MQISNKSISIIEIIEYLEEQFTNKNAKVVDISDKKCYIEFKFIGKPKIELKKYDLISDMNEKIERIEEKINNMENKLLEELNLKEKVKEVFKDNKLKMKLFEEFEKMLSEKYVKKDDINKKFINLENKINIDKKENIENKKEEENTFKSIKENMVKLKNEFNNKINEIKKNMEKKKNIEEKINKYIIPKISEDNLLINKLSDKLNNKNNNYITIKVNIKKKDINKRIYFLRQNKIGNLSNFERDDIEIIIDNENVPIKQFKEVNDIKDNFFDKDNFVGGNYIDIKEDERSDYDEKDKSLNDKIDKRLSKKLNVRFRNIFWEIDNFKSFYKYYWNFSNKGIHSIKIIFKKRIYDCSDMFNIECFKSNIIEIDCSHFDCSQVTNCSRMFYNLRSLKKLNLGELDFRFSSNFEYMFYNCKNLEELDVSNFNTCYSQSFESMFEGCIKLKAINVSKFDSHNCKNIGKMFYECQNLTEIDMLNWDLKHIGDKDECHCKTDKLCLCNILNDFAIENLFCNCQKLQNIKISCNFSNIDSLLQSVKIFEGLPENGSFTWKKDINCYKILECLPKNWNIKTE